MASWGNQENQPFNQDMDSDGHKLVVRSVVLWTDLGYRTQLTETNDGAARKSLEVRGSTLMHDSSVVGDLQTSPVLKVEGTILNDGNTERYQAEFIAAGSAQNALKADGEVHIWEGGAIRGRLLPGYDLPPYQGAFAINTGATPESDPDPSIFIGQASPNGGNDTLISSRRVMVGGGGSSAVTPDDTYLVQLNGPVRVAGLDGLPGDAVAMKTAGLIVSTGLKLPDGEDVIQIGRLNRLTGNHTIVQIGEGAGETDGRGSQVNIRGDMTIQTGDGTNPGDLSVGRNVHCQGNLTVNGTTGLHGNVDMDGNANIDGNLTVHGEVELLGPVTTSLNVEGDTQLSQDLQVSGSTALGTILTVGTPQQSSNTTLNGNLTVTKDTQIAGNLDIVSKFKVDNTIGCLLDTTCAQSLTVNGDTNLVKNVVMGTAQSPIQATIQGELQITEKLGVDGEASLSELHVQDESQFIGRSFHSAGVAVSSQGQTFSGMIKQNSRLEFFLDGTLRFYIDASGGHNA